ncbi:hypothetical protein QN277_017597 [Acacia crassicarpa]|uniref:Selenoprotein H n=1 Tax=Acacia crassicarpa TaxID=499986 RepID=A0AAE1JRL2_9FABA|nr:hypothetical protein QN277_017597 [Acacia crassicarpa]
MAPKKTQGKQTDVPAATSSVRVTRASAKRAAQDSVSVPELPEKKTKKPKLAGKGKSKEEPKEDEPKAGSGSAGDGKGKSKEEPKEDEPKAGSGSAGDGKGKSKEEPKEDEPKAGSGSAGDGSKCTIVIEHCKQCNSFKTRANLVKEGLEKSVDGIVVILNPEKPRKGCFEIRKEGGETFISLLDMKRPFEPMKQLDMDKVIADIVDKINN